MREPEPSYARAVDKRPRGRRSRGAHEDQVEHVQEVLSRSSKLRELRSVEYARCAKVGAQLADGGCGVVCAGIRRLVRDEIGWQLAEQRRRAISLCLRAPQLFCTQPKACAKRARCMRLRWCARLRIKDIFAANLRGLGHQLRERAGSMLRAGVWPKTECTSQSHRTPAPRFLPAHSAADAHRNTPTDQVLRFLPQANRPFASRHHCASLLLLRWLNLWPMKRAQADNSADD